MKPHLHMGHALAGLFLSGALFATVQTPVQRPAPQPLVSQLPGPPAIADDAVPAATNLLAGYLAANPACRGITNGCQICVRTSGNQAQCSTPGFACAPAEWRCQKAAD